MRETNELERLIGPASALWLAVFVIPMFLFTPDTATRGACRCWRRRVRAAGTLIDTVRRLRTLQQRAALSHRLHALQ